MLGFCCFDNIFPATSGQHFLVFGCSLSTLATTLLQFNWNNCIKKDGGCTLPSTIRKQGLVQYSLYVHWKNCGQMYKAPSFFGIVNSVPVSMHVYFRLLVGFHGYVVNPFLSWLLKRSFYLLSSLLCQTPDNFK